MRLVLDTNVVVSGVLWHGSPNSLLGAAQGGGIRLLTGMAALRELRRVLSKPKLASPLAAKGLTAAGIVETYAAACDWIDVATPIPRVVRDPDDDHLVALALAGRADILVSGDGDLLALGSVGDIRVVTPAQALAMIEESKT